MTDKDYKTLLGHKLEDAYKVGIPQEEPSSEDILRWQTQANVRKIERKRNLRMVYGLAAVFIVALYIGVAVMAEPPEVNAGGDGEMDISYMEEQEEGIRIEKYTSMENLPQKVKEEYKMFDPLPEGFELLEIKIVQARKSQCCDIYILKEKHTIIINQYRMDRKTIKESVISEGVKETWNSTDVYIKKYEYDENQVVYFFKEGEITFNITCSVEIPKEDIMQLVGTIT